MFWFSRPKFNVCRCSERGHIRRNELSAGRSVTFVQARVRNLLETLAEAGQPGERENVQYALPHAHTYSDTDKKPDFSA